jgi:lipopolysaccharide export LptBFGC system permease protein LptF
MSNGKQIALLNSYLAKPIFYVFLFLLAAYLCIYPPRFEKKFITITIAIISGFALFFVLNIMHSLAISARITVISGIWVPVLLFLNVIILLLLAKEQGRNIY